MKNSVAFAKNAAAFKLQGRTKFQGLSISIENKKGSTRKWHDPHGKETGSTHMYLDYGYIKGTKGTDGDHVDVYLGPDEASLKVFIVNQSKKPEGSTKGDGKAWTVFDEQKVMLGYNKVEDAEAAYLKQYDDPRFFGNMKELAMDDFKKKVLAKENHGKKIASLIARARGMGKTSAHNRNSNPHKSHEFNDGTREGEERALEPGEPGAGAQLASLFAPHPSSAATRPKPLRGGGASPPVTGIQQTSSPALTTPPSTEQTSSKIGMVNPMQAGGGPTPASGAPAMGQIKPPAPIHAARQVGKPMTPGSGAAVGMLSPGKGKVAMGGMTPMTAKKTNWDLPFKPTTATKATKKPFSAMAKSSGVVSKARKFVQDNPQIKNTARSVIKSPRARDVLAGAGAGALVGGTTGAATTQKGESRVKRGLRGALYGGGAGAVAGSALHDARQARHWKKPGYRDLVMKKGITVAEKAKLHGSAARSQGALAVVGGLGAIGALSQDEKKPKKKTSSLRVAEIALEHGASPEGTAAAIIAGEKLAGIVGAIGSVGKAALGAGKAAAKHKKTLGAVAGTTAIVGGALAAKKGIDTVSNKVQGPRHALAPRRARGMGHGIIGR